MRPPLSDHSPLAGQTGWTTLDVASGYGDYVVAQVEELSARYPVDGFFFDIVWVEPNYSPAGLKRLREAGVDLADEFAVQQQSRRELLAFTSRLTHVARKHHGSATIFYNGIVDAHLPGFVDLLTHVEVESLPTSGGLWGYMHYPVVARFARTHGLPILGMTGRFHKAWADFGGLKTVDQLSYECGTILSAGGAISVGDQLDPRGKLDPAVYRTIGTAFDRVQQLEPWLVGATPSAEVAVLGHHHPVDHGARQVAGHTEDVEGAAQMFLELGVQFDIVDPQRTDLSHYDLVVVPDGYIPTSAMLAALEERRRSGAHLLVSGTGCLDQPTGQFLLADMPVLYKGAAPTIPSYLRPTTAVDGRPELATDYHYAFYEAAHVVEPVDDALDVQGALYQALYNRTWKHFTSHAQAPVGASLDAPVVVSGRNLTYLAAPLFAAYRRHDYWVYRALVEGVLDRCLPARLLRVEGPGWVEAALHVQELDAGRRHIVHLTAYHPRRTAHPVPHVDESAPTAGLAVLVRLDEPPSHVYLAPERQDLPFSSVGPYIRVALPPIGTHTVLVLE